VNISRSLLKNYSLLNNSNRSNILFNKSNSRSSKAKELSKMNPVDILRISRLVTKIKTSTVTQRNIQDSMSLIETAKNTLDDTHNMVQQLKELAVQYQAGNLSDSDKASIENEAITITRIISKDLKGTDYRGKALFDQPSLLIGLGDGQTINIDLTKIVQNKKADENIAQFATQATETLEEQAVIVPAEVSLSESQKNDSLPKALSTEAISQKELITTELPTSIASLPTPSNVLYFTRMMAFKAYTSTATQSINSLSVVSIETPSEVTPKYSLENSNIVIPDQNGYTGYKKVYDNKSNLVYEGNLKNGVPDGYGKIYDKKKVVYEGDFSMGTYNGYGTLYGNNGKILYQGDIKNGTPDGYGTVYETNGKMIYQGGLKDGYREGWGTTYSNGKSVESKQYTDGTTHGGTKPPTDGGTKPPTDDGTKPPTDDGTKPPTDGGTKPPTDDDTKPPTDDGTKPPTDGGTKPPTDDGTKPPTDDGTKPPTDGGTKPPTDGGTKPPTDGGTKPPTDDGTKPPTDDGTKPPTDGGTKPPTDGGTKPPIDTSNFSLYDLKNMNMGDLLNVDFLDNVVLKNVDSVRSNLAISHEVMGYQLNGNSKQQSIDEGVLSRLRDVDTARKTMENVKLQLTQQVSLTLMKNLDDYRSNILKLLS
jgi:flagellin-like hook-associated protein FlgL